nr:hypothetical protein [Mesorhizobium sp.]
MDDARHLPRSDLRPRWCCFRSDLRHLLGSNSTFQPEGGVAESSRSVAGALPLLTNVKAKLRLFARLGLAPQHHDLDPQLAGHLQAEFRFTCLAVPGYLEKTG